jgi:transcriptional regulator with XRE-family HTH domain
MPYLRAWREALGLSRPEVVNRLLILPEVAAPIDQATLAKWETGESRVTVEDLELLAKVYGVTADRLFFPPNDTATPALLKEAHGIITGRDPAAVKAWLASGQFLPKTEK